MRANRALIGLGCNLKSKTTEIISIFVNFKRTTPLLTQQSDSEILNIDCFLQNRLLCPLLRWRLNDGEQNDCYLRALISCPPQAMTSVDQAQSLHPTT